MAKSAKPASRPPMTLLQILVIVLLVAGLLVIVDLNRRTGEAQRLEADRNFAFTEVAQLQYQQSVLQTQVAYATTDAAVIAWAHENGKLVQPDEVLVVPVVPTAAPTPAPPPPDAPPLPPGWMLWRDLFIDPAP